MLQLTAIFQCTLHEYKNVSSLSNIDLNSCLGNEYLESSPQKGPLPIIVP